jgi:outer membrane lipoprotein-sorting protein
MRRRTFLRLGLAAPLAFAASSLTRAARADAALDQALADVAKARAKIDTLQGPFTQERTIALLASKVKSTGKMWMVRPDRLRWELDPPDAATYWVLPDGLAYKTKSGSGKIGKNAQGPMGGVLGDLLVLLGGDLAQLKSRYDLTLVKRDAAQCVIHAVPKDKALAKTTQRVELELSGDLATMKRVVIVEKGNDRSDVTFGALVKNAKIDAKIVAGP